MQSRGVTGSWGHGDTHGERCPGPQWDTELLCRALPAEQCPHRGEPGLAGMLLPAAIGCVDWFLQGGEKHLKILQGVPGPKGEAGDEL